MKPYVLRAALTTLLVMAVGAAPATVAQAATVAKPAPTQSNLSAKPDLARPASIVEAAAAGLWHCSPFNDIHTYACTTIKNAPAGGVQVLDRNNNTIYRLYNGDSITLKVWFTDTIGLCGVNGNPYVWAIEWANNGRHEAYIGDYYLNTGTYSNWSTFTDSWGTLGSQGAGSGSGYCNTFPVWARVR
ncbi:hypothetical protein [Micromonospora sp. NPDC001898]|uniref:hypothetical protein n=1 Tax=Micromonospora sp. NPDC001898 TaxID=3364221 RepID=UPI00369CE1A1